MASFYLVVWQVFAWLFGKFLFGCLVSFRLVKMGNGAMRLEAELNGIPFRATFAKKSKEYPAIMENGGIKMPFEKQKEYVERRVTS